MGILGILFVVWEVWWTGLDASSSADEATDEFLEALDSPDTPGASGTPGTSAIEPSAAPCQELPDGTAIGCAPNVHEAAEDGATLGVLSAPRLGDHWRWPVKSGTSTEVLNAGALGHYEHTQFPDQHGNMAIAGHRLTYGDPLRDQDSFVPGDEISFTTADGTYVYEVYASEVVEPSEIDVIAPVPGEPSESPERSVLTLTTCHPLWSNAQRLITYAELVDFTPPGPTVQAGAQ